ncbi:MAG: mucoidy inhibitor MuiA family protein [Nibricoccus sp.]
MKTRFLVSLLAIPFALTSALVAAPVPVTSQITAATVYTDRAIVSRVAKIDLAAGEAELVFEKLPAALIDQSLQVSGRGTAGVTILDVGTRTTHVEAVTDPRIKALAEQINELEGRKEALLDRAKIIEHQGELLEKIEDAIASPPSKEESARLSVQESEKLLAFADATGTKLAAERRAIDVQREELEDKNRALRAQLADLQGKSGADRSYKTVIVRVAAVNAGTLDLSLAYAVPGASWTPSYDARLRSEERSVEVSYFGTVQQNTGEDWKNVALVLSTARPGLGGAAPELETWVVDVFHPRPAPAGTAVMTGAGGGDESVVLEAFSVDKRKRIDVSNFKALEGAPSGSDLTAAEFAGATVDSSVTSASFKIAAPATILSDNATQKVAIMTIKLAAKLQYQATPRLQETAFLSAYVTNSTDFPLLAGSVNTFLGDSFVATSELKTVMPSEKFELALGADESIAVKRKVVNRFSEETGLTGSGRRVTYEFLVTLTNNKKTAERVVFKELLPVSRNEKIVVKLIGPAERDVGTVAAPKEVTREADGRLVWRLDLKPGEKREIALKFSVEHPADVQVTGLE